MMVWRFLAAACFVMAVSRVANAADPSNAWAGHNIVVTADFLKAETVAITVRNGGAEAVAGAGFIVGQKDQRLLVVTAGHVLLGLENGNQVSVSIYIEPGKVQTVQGVIESDDDAGPTTDGPRFVSIPHLPSQPTLQSYSLEDVRAGDFVGTLGRAGSWAPDQIAGQIVALAPGGLIQFKGSEIQPSYSGGPLIAGQGIVGILRERTDPFSAFAISIAAVKRAFQNQFATKDWHWLVASVPRVAPPGFITLSRNDSIPSLLALRRSDGFLVAVAPSTVTAVAPGRYTLIATAGSAGDLDCSRPDVVIAENRTSIEVVQCRYKVAGIWKGLGTSMLTLSPTTPGTFDAVLTGDPFYSGSGVATFDGTTLSLSITKSDNVMWDAALRASQAGLRGEINLVMVGSRPIPLMFRRP
jgi:hypothetical protein